MWPFSELGTHIPEGASVDEARLAGRLPPASWLPPANPTVADALRTLRAVGQLARDLIRTVRQRTAVTTSTDESPSDVMNYCRQVLASLNVQLEIHDLDKVPAQGGLVFMWNQASHLDHLALPAAIPRPFLSVYNNAMAQTPYYGKYLKRRGHYWVDKNDEAQWRASLAQAAEDIKAGVCVLISPEGTRSWDGKLLPMKRGAFILAEASTRPIVCVTVVGGHRRLPRGSMVVRRGALDVAFSGPIPTDGALSGDRLKSKVAETFRCLKRRYSRQR